MVRVRYSFGSRHTGRIANIAKQRKEFPKIVQEVIDMTDIVIEVIDARFIEETRNEELENYILSLGKKLIYVMNKADLIDFRNFKSSLRPYVLVSTHERFGSVKLRNLLKQLSKKVEHKKINRDNLNKTLIGVIGYPNTGKSTLINFLVGRPVAKTGNEAGFTKGLQKLSLTKELMILDSPGVIPAKEYSMSDKNKMSRQTLLSARSSGKVKDPELSVQYLINDLPGVIERHYKLDGEYEDSELLLEELAIRSNFKKKGNKPDVERAARVILTDWQNGKIKIK
jgi:ribosome biogenesis GTPase A